MLALPLVSHDGYVIQLLNIAILNAIVVLGLNFATGWTGQINFGQAAFYGLGAYTTAIAGKAGMPWIATPVLSVAVVMIASLALGLPTLRLRTYYLAMTTIGFGEIIRLIIVHWEPVTGGTSGLRAIPGISVFGLAPQGQIQHYYLLVAALALAALVASRIRHSALGRAMIATKDSEIAAEQSGVDTVRTKLLAFMIGAVYAGLAGCLYASSIRFISPDSFSGVQAILLMTMLIVGGMGSITGCIIGAVALTVLPEMLRFLGQWYLVLYGLGVIAVIVLAPGGLASIATLIPRLRQAGAR
ncbi:branched-chain amino acid ABC transporter permease [Rhodopseudomonas sp. P2A-2r]|uniref:branched-chain amino acid ABC transporter permease n=1 Tax=Rhodopseudomonas sp. P2A-2r TaxID=2991972 RepID=UPI002234B787|nr:branched-chain amino acid ABC transporter permease [Rhodopseudomonas sp. P2A-2r]UZE48907.1 branched-chain amino acid ABC transporter permease [Rhodopseudomonas sp. P2A-2r]